MNAVTIGTGSTLISAANHGRNFIHIYNASDEAIYVAYDGGSAAVGTGIPIAVGDTLMLNNDGSKSCFTRAVYGICATGGKDVHVADA
jgi:TPP-dependent pyruvate/acetoin dehydrogenase alpha subunit